MSSKINEQNSKKAYTSILSKEDNILPKFVLSSLVLHCFSLLMLMFFATVLYRLAVRPSPTLVQNLEGGAVVVTAASATYREPELIRRFVGETAVGLYSASRKESNPSSFGVSLNTKNKDSVVTTTAWEVAFSLSEKDNYREAFLEQLAEYQKKLPVNIWTSKANIFLKVSHIREPEELEKGKWKVDIIAYLLLFDQGQLLGKAIPFNKSFYVQAVDNPPLLLGEEATPIQQTVWNSRQAQLEIYDITNLEKK
jgi:hypothetical protein